MSIVKTEKPCWPITAWLLRVVTAVVVMLAGCEPPEPQQVRHCPSKNSVEQWLAILAVRSTAVPALKATSKCKATFYEAKKAKPRNESFTAKLWLDWQHGVRFLGDVAFNARGIDIGCNGQQFWLALKPDELGNSYYWGRWSDQDAYGAVAASSRIMFEAFGVIHIADDNFWSLENAANFDILVQRHQQGNIVKKVYVDNCDELVQRIEYFNRTERLIGAVELSKYKAIGDGMMLPRMVRLVSFDPEQREDSVTIKIDSIKPTAINRKIFERQEPKGFKEVYRIIEGKAVEQQQ